MVLMEGPVTRKAAMAAAFCARRQDLPLGVEMKSAEA